MQNIIDSFPGYEFVKKEEDKKYHNMFRGTDLGKGGYVYGEPGVYGNVALIDIAGLHPASMIAMNYFGEYTTRFKEIRDARILIKHKDYDTARQIMDGALAPYLDDPSTAKSLSNALKTAINSCYGLTSAKFSNPMNMGEINNNNIVALRGALFMRTLQDEIIQRGFKVIHIKTDSIKIPDATKDIINFCVDFAKSYGYEFEFEAFYDRICLVNDAVYVAKFATEEKCNDIFGFVPDENKEEGGKWTATGTQFAVPYVFKTLFSKDDIRVIDDVAETKTVTTALYLDMNEDLPDVTAEEKLLEKEEKKFKAGEYDEEMIFQARKSLGEDIAKGHNYRFIGKVGRFCPLKPGCGGGLLMAERNGKYTSAVGTKGYRWLEADMVQQLNKENDIDYDYYEKLVTDAICAISLYGNYEWFVSDDPYIPPEYVDGHPVYPETEPF